MSNLSKILGSVKHIHFIGIGGSGMYPLAQILHNKGYYLSGSDNNETETLAAVRNMGIPVFMGQRAENIEGAEVIVYTAAIMNDNPELIAAKNSGKPVLERSEMLGYITSLYNNAICVAGTHGKTTTCSMLTSILVCAGLDISAFIGGKLPLIGGSGLLGNSEIFVCEACEFNDTFLHLEPDTSVILNIDNDHLDYFGNMENLISSFGKFSALTSGKIFIFGDDDKTRQTVHKLNNTIITFGEQKVNTFFADFINCLSKGYSFVLYYNKKLDNNHLNSKKSEYSTEMLGTINLNVPGKHNIINALAAASVSFDLGVSFEHIKKGLETFTGAGRRFEIIGKFGGAVVVDDYAHHPTEIAATLRAAKDMPYKRVIAVFQPFTFSRTKMLLNDFAEALQIADVTVLTDIMGSREKNEYGIYTSDLAAITPNSVFFEQDKSAADTDKRKEENFGDVIEYVKKIAEEGDLIIILGCGDVYKIAKAIVD
ncbi:MAG: UDP-N-acetylmuramate--L-alanine ligase [Ruminococcus sp.]|jgi:UDP-N-acetylmuramate--alanine ligase|nr:UDP-N-acetylmuramate--L-alanine ligase [Ruminococcus sp.]